MNAVKREAFFSQEKGWIRVSQPFFAVFSKIDARNIVYNMFAYNFRT